MILGALKLLVAAVVLGGLTGLGYVVVSEAVDPGEDFIAEPVDFDGNGIVVRALGDSVSAGFGYGDADGVQFGVEDLAICGPQAAEPLCQDPDGVAYPARFARTVPEVNFESFAISGSTPADWLDEGEGKGAMDLGGQLQKVVDADPDVTVLTLGANPLLKSFLLEKNRFCGSTPDEDEARECVRNALDRAEVVRRLGDVYTKLLATPADGRNGIVVVFHYPETRPASAFGLNIEVLTAELRRAIERAAAEVRARNPERGERLVLAEPGPFLRHGCRSEQPWILKVDTCIHPNAAGHAQLAAVLARAVAERRGIEEEVDEVEREAPRFAEPGTSCGVLADRNDDGYVLESRLGVTEGRMPCAEIEGLFRRYVADESPCASQGAGTCWREYEGWRCVVPTYGLYPANFNCTRKERTGVIGLYAAPTTPRTAYGYCEDGRYGGDPVNIRANFDCEAAERVAAYGTNFGLGFRCETETTGIESSHSVCTLDAARVEWDNGA